MTESSPLDEAEFAELLKFLRRYSETNMDQWEMWRMPTSFGQVYVEVRRSPSPGLDDTAYLSVGDSA